MDGIWIESILEVPLDLILINGWLARMSNEVNTKLTKDEKDFLYSFVKDRSMVEAGSKPLPDLLSRYRGVYDRADINKMIKKLEALNYIGERLGEHGYLSYGITNITTYKKLYNEFRLRRYYERVRDSIKQGWSFLWRHFIITIIVALITAYLYIHIWGIHSLT